MPWLYLRTLELERRLRTLELERQMKAEIPFIEALESCRVRRRAAIMKARRAIKALDNEEMGALTC